MLDNNNNNKIVEFGSFKRDVQTNQMNEHFSEINSISADMANDIVQNLVDADFLPGSDDDKFNNTKNLVDILYCLIQGAIFQEMKDCGHENEYGKYPQFFKGVSSIWEMGFDIGVFETEDDGEE